MLRTALPFPQGPEPSAIRRQVLLWGVVAAALAAGVLGQARQQGQALLGPAGPSTSVRDQAIASTLPSEAQLQAEASLLQGTGLLAPVQPAPAPVALGGGANALATASTRVVGDVRTTVADALTLRELRARIMAPPASIPISAAQLDELSALVREAQLSLNLSTAQMPAPRGANGVPAAPDPAALQTAIDEVRAAQTTLAEAVKKRDAAPQQPVAGSAPPAPAAMPATAGSASALSSAIAASSLAGAASEQALADARARLRSAQAALEELLAVPPAAAITAAKQAIEAALADTPAAPEPAQISDAKNAVARAQKDVEAASAPPSQEQVAQALAAAEGHAPQTVRTGGSAQAVRGGSTGAMPVPAPASAPAGVSAKPEEDLRRLLQGPDPQRLADTKLNLENAQKALAALEQRAAFAANPESQPTVIAARAQLAKLIAPPDPARLSAAQAAMADAQRAVDELVARSAVPAATPPGNGQAGPAQASAPRSAAMELGSATAGVDAVAQAETRLTEAQGRLRELIAKTEPAAAAVPNSPSSSAAGTSLQGAGAPPSAGGTVAEVVAAPVSAPALAPPMGGSASASNPAQAAITAIEMRAWYVVASVLTVQRLHPSAVADRIMPQLATAPGAAAGRVSTAIAWPATGPITQPFGVPELGVGAPHTGVDIGIPIATPIRSAAAGIVTFAGGDPSTGYGYYAIVDHGRGVSTLYGHLALPAFLHPGQFVYQGSLIGLSGSTGHSTGPHLHFEVRLNGAPLDPLRVLPSGP